MDAHAYLDVCLSIEALLHVRGWVSVSKATVDCGVDTIAGGVTD
jgi:hypothetical protein